MRIMDVHDHVVLVSDHSLEMGDPGHSARLNTPFSR